MIKHGWINIDKPAGLSSARVVAVVKKLLSVKKVGHAGTLDPIATGVLPLAFGEATKTIQFVQDRDKEYVFTMKFGEETDSYDKAGKVVATSAHCPSLDEIKAKLPQFTGHVMQAPPVYSAIKVDGKRSYELARQGKQQMLPPRQVCISSVHIEAFDASKHELMLRIKCSKGTYVRSLAHDLAKSLGTLGHVTSLRRTRVGIFDETNIISLAKLEEIVHNACLNDAVLPAWRVLDDILALDFSQSQRAKIIHGVAVPMPEQKILSPQVLSSGVKVLAKIDGVPIAVGEVDGQCFKPKRIFKLGGSDVDIEGKEKTNNR